MRGRGLHLGFLAATLAMTGSLAAQTHIEVRGGLSVGSHTATAAGLDMAPSFSYEVLVVRQTRPSLALFAGFAHTAFGCEEGFCTDRALTVTGNHGVAGVELRRGGPWVRFGALVGTAEVGSDGESPNLGVGIHAGAGLTIGAGRLRFLPGIANRWMKADTPSSADHASALALDLGIGVRLGSGGS